MSITPMFPREITAALDSHIIGQQAAKKAVANALRNRWRRSQLDEELRQEVTPKNILMIGPTGVGKTEIARRLAKLANAPFIKVEATKFTEVGYVGKDVESIIRDLVESSIKMSRENAQEKVEQRAYEAAVERVLDLLMTEKEPSTENVFSNMGFGQEVAEAKEQAEEDKASEHRQMRKKLKNGELDEQEIEAEVNSRPVSMDIMGPPGMEEMTQQLQDMFQSLGNQKKKKRKIQVKDAMRIFQEDEASKMVNEEEIKFNALDNVEQNGIVFIDELDKVCPRSENMSGVDVSREGVQRDLLPLVEGCTVSTKHGQVKTDHILFITSGAFHLTKPSDLVPELQGRLPIRVELGALTVEDFVRILTEPDASLTEQYTALMGTEGVTLLFRKDGVKRIAQIAWQINERVENIGARRLHTVMEKLLDEVSYNACDMEGEKVIVDKKFVNQALNDLIKDEDLTKYIL